MRNLSTSSISHCQDRKTNPETAQPFRCKDVGPWCDALRVTLGLVIIRQVLTLEDCEDSNATMYSLNRIPRAVYVHGLDLRGEAGFQWIRGKRQAPGPAKMTARSRRS